jgi:hypothetical protein
MLGDCQYRYSCLSCDHHRVTLEDQPQLEADFQSLQQDNDNHYRGEGVAARLPPSIQVDF